MTKWICQFCWNGDLPFGLVCEDCDGHGNVVNRSAVCAGDPLELAKEAIEKVFGKPKE